MRKSSFSAEQITSFHRQAEAPIGDHASVVASARPWLEFVAAVLQRAHTGDSRERDPGSAVGRGPPTVLWGPRTGARK